MSKPLRSGLASNASSGVLLVVAVAAVLFSTGVSAQSDQHTESSVESIRQQVLLDASENRMPEDAAAMVVRMHLQQRDAHWAEPVEAELSALVDPILAGSPAVSASAITCAKSICEILVVQDMAAANAADGWQAMLSKLMASPHWTLSQAEVSMLGRALDSGDVVFMTYLQFPARQG